MPERDGIFSFDNMAIGHIKIDELGRVEYVPYDTETHQTWSFSYPVYRPARPKKLIRNGPATIVLWSDGKKTVSKCDGCDERDDTMGLLLCTLRRALGNSTMGPRWERVARRIAKDVSDPEELRALGKALGWAADAAELEE